MNREDLLQIWDEFCKDNDFKLNPDQAHIDLIIEGLLENEKQYGLKLCPCRVRDGNPQRDLALICPCNFKTHTTWESQGRCWCGLFVKR